MGEADELRPGENETAAFLFRRFALRLKYSLPPIPFLKLKKPS
jgi:hypothetical protein